MSDSKFLSELILRDLGDGKRFELVGPLAYRSALLGYDLIVPAHTITDLASIPILSHHRIWSRGAVVHDYLYQRGETTREIADAVLKEAMDVLGVPAWRRWIVYTNLRLFGQRAWDSHREREQQT